MEPPAHTPDDSLPPPRYRPRGEAPHAALPAFPAPATGAAAGPVISLGPRDVLAGRLVFDGDLRVQGSVEGETTVSGDLHVEGQGAVKAKVQARNLSVRGTLEGEVTAKERLLVAGSGTVSGTIKVARLAVEDGALLNGTITMERSSANGRASGPGA
jgi:cytoskeletal protein CcmA (bactofilin family)